MGTGGKGGGGFLTIQGPNLVHPGTHGYFQTCTLWGGLHPPGMLSLVITTRGSWQLVRSKNGLSIDIDEWVKCAAWGNHTIFGFCLNSLNSVN